MRKLCTAMLLTVTLAAGTSGALAQEPNFGRAVALSETDLLIGQPVNFYGPGTVYTYRIDDAGAWREVSRLTASDAGRMDDFGRAVSLDGNRLAVGAPRKHDGAGVAYVFERQSPNDEWRQTAIIEPPAEGDHSDYAAALALAGDELLVGSPEVDSTGVVYRYVRDADGWSLRDVIRPDDVSGPASFGQDLTREGDRLLVGAPAADSAAGRVYVFDHGGDGWTRTAVLSPPNDLEGSTALGATVRLDGDAAYVGAGRAGAVVIYTRTGDEWSPVQTLQADVEGRTLFGIAIDRVGEELWVGAAGVDGFMGRVYRFARNAGEWRQVGVIEPPADTADGGTPWPYAFGYSIASNGDRAVVGLPYADFGEGRALVLGHEDDGSSAGETLEGWIFRIGEDLAAGTRCRDGRIEEFTCSNIEVVAHVPTSALGGARGVWVNDVWGWTDPETGNDYALVARRDGAAFVDVTNPSAPRLVGSLPRTHGSPPSVWRDIKVIGNYAFVVSDGAGAHGMQVFDLTRLRDVAGTPAVFEPDTTYHEMFSAHNVVADTANAFVYVVGANGGGETCGGGLHMVDVREPLRPTFAGCYNDRSGANERGYTHDAQCLTYEGPDERYRGRQVCIGSNEKEINIADVTDKENPVTIGRNSYPNVAYAHQGWFDPEQRYFYMNDEMDEVAGSVEGTRTIVWDLAKLDDPIVAHEYIGPVPSSDHNLFVKGDRVYESNYGSGLRVLDISERENPREIAFFDSAPLNDDQPGHSASQSGAWSNYPFFDSGVVVFTSVREGLFLVRVMDDVPTS